MYDILVGLLLDTVVGHRARLLREPWFDEGSHGRSQLNEPSNLKDIMSQNKP